MSDDAHFEQLRATLGGAYTLERELGGGGMSRVYIAVENRLQRRVVIKVLSPELSEGLSGERFEREIGLAAGLQQANIVPVLAAGDANGLPWYSMPYVEGESLRARLDRGRLPTTEAVGILKDVARALAYAHERGVVHRDIKPENVLLSGDAAVVTDFGIAKALSASKARAPGGTLTQVGTSLGTPAYMAPEQAVGADVDHRADIYSWGVMAYELLAGTHPFASRTTTQQLIAAHIAEAPAPLPSGTPAAQVIARALAKDPESRPASAKELIDALNNAVTSERPASSAPAQRSWVAAAVIATVMVAGIAIALSSRRGDSAKATSSANVISTIAVLPFVNTGGDARDEYFSDGMTDELAHALSQLPGLRLAGRISSFSFKGKAANARDVGTALDVAGIVEGTVRRSGDRLRVTATLTSTTDGKQRWSNSYESTAKDVFTVQDELTRAIVNALAPALRGEHSNNVAQQARGTENAEAYDYYLRGYHFFQLRGVQNLRLAAENFAKAIATDRNFARAYGGLALVYTIMPGYIADPLDTLPALTTKVAKQALALDSTQVDARLALANRYAYNDAAAEGERMFRAVLRDAPDNPTAHQWLGNCLTLLGRNEEAIKELERAAALDPLAAVIVDNLAISLVNVGRLPDAVRAAQRTFQLDPLFDDPPMLMAYVLNGQPDSALRHLRDVQRNEPDAFFLKGALAFANAAKGNWTAVDSISQATLRNRAGSTPLDDAFIGLASGNSKPLAQLLASRSGQHAYLQAFLAMECTPYLVSLRNDPAVAPLAGKNCPAIPWPIRPR